MTDKVLKTIRSFELIPYGSSVTVALSGGADSVSLLYCLDSLKDELGISLRAAHVNHCLRGAEADRDEIFVRELCSSLNIPLEVLKTDVAAEAEAKGESDEEAGRRIRYSFLDKVSDGGLIATAHNLNDRAETFVFNFTRGAGLKGLCSIPVRRGKVIRPLIDCSREEIEKYCSDNRISFVTDSTNLTDEYTRNKIRLNIIPQLKQINPSFEKSVSRCLSSINEDEKYLSSLAVNLISAAECEAGYIADILFNAPVPVRNRAVSMIIENRFDIKTDRETVDRILSLSEGGMTEIYGSNFVRLRKGILDFPDFCKSENICVAATEGEYSLPGCAVKIEIVNKDYTIKQKSVNNDVLAYSCDCCKVSGKLVIRNRRVGDSIRLAGRGCTKTLKKLFNENSIPPELRDSVYFVCDNNGIVAAEGFGVAERCRVTDETERVLYISFRRLNHDT